MALPGGASAKEPACECKIREASLGGEDPLEEGMETTPVFLPGESQGEGNFGRLWFTGFQESDTTEETEHQKFKNLNLSKSFFNDFLQM